MVALKAIPTIIRYGVKFYKIAKKDLDEWLSRGASHVKKPSDRQLQTAQKGGKPPSKRSEIDANDPRAPWPRERSDDIAGTVDDMRGKGKKIAFTKKWGKANPRPPTKRGKSREDLIDAMQAVTGERPTMKERSKTINELLGDMYKKKGGKIGKKVAKKSKKSSHDGNKFVSQFYK